MEKIIKKLDDKIFVTGDSSGLGYEVCKISCKHFSKVTGLSRTENIDCDWNHIQFDLINNQLSDLKEQLKSVDTLILNAAMAHSSLSIVGSMDFSRKIFLLNYHIPTQLAKIWARSRIKQRKKGHVVFISSICSKKIFKGLSDYSATKSAINSFAKVMAVELGKKKIRVNIVLPGYMTTQMTKELTDEQVTKISKRMPSNSLLESSNVAKSIVSLIRDDFAFCNGSEFIIDGGQVL